MATRWGICGAGKISGDFCSSLYCLPAGEHQIVAVAARNIERAQTFGKFHEACKAYGSYQELASDPNVEVVYVGTIHPTHHRICLMMLNAGKHVLCEKPMTMNLREAREVMQKAKEKNLFFMEGCWSRCFPAYDQIRKELASSSLGVVKMVSASICHDAVPFNLERLVKKSAGAGALLDVGCYPVMFATMIYDEMPDKILAEGTLTDEGVDDSGCILLKYKNGGLANIFYSLAYDAPSVARVYGTKGKIEIAQDAFCPTKVTVPSGTYEFKLPEGPSKAPLTFENTTGLSYEADCVRKCLKEGRTECSVISHKHSEIIMTILDECRRQLGVTYDADMRL